LDEDRFAPFWERVQELDVPVYLHPANPACSNAMLEYVRTLAQA
jgi:2,3-dihydroxybenzoate decarboxylase